MVYNKTKLGIINSDQIHSAHQTQYYAHYLSQKHRDPLKRIANVLLDSGIDLNPHQIEAALFALESPISRGVILADEVGLGKTIEAGLLLAQYFSEHKRKLLVICPATLRKQ